MLFAKTIIKKKYLPLSFFLLILLMTLPHLSAEASVGLLYFRANPGPAVINLEWETGQETDNFGFNIYRSLTNDYDDAQKLNSNLIPSQANGPLGARYDWPDNNVQAGVTYTYWLEDIDIRGNSTVHEPESATPGSGNTIPTIPSPGNSTATPTPTRTPTRTPTPTTQTTTVAQTPTRTPTTAASSSNPTATNEPVIQPTAATNSFSATSAPVNPTTNATSAPVIEEANQAPTQSPGESESTPTAEVLNLEAEDPGQEVAEIDSQSSSGIDIQPIGEGSADGEETANHNPTNGDGSNRSTAIIMALIISVVLLLIGGGGIIILLINRTKQTRI